jgi:hypothetical protein
MLQPPGDRQAGLADRNPKDRQRGFKNRLFSPKIGFKHIKIRLFFQKIGFYLGNRRVSKVITPQSH